MFIGRGARSLIIRPHKAAESSHALLLLFFFFFFASILFLERSSSKSYFLYIFYFSFFILYFVLASTSRPTADELSEPLAQLNKKSSTELLDFHGLRDSMVNCESDGAVSANIVLFGEKREFFEKLPTADKGRKRMHRARAHSGKKFI